MGVTVGGGGSEIKAEGRAKSTGKTHRPCSRNGNDATADESVHNSPTQPHASHGLCPPCEHLAPLKAGAQHGDLNHAEQNARAAEKYNLPGAHFFVRAVKYSLQRGERKGTARAGKWCRASKRAGYAG